ncbi:MAG: DUF1343 domain-containing protein [Bacteroidales bacterium]|nr:DUF1343 domain-containing protein [Bacteroidales bacterium]
MKSPIIFLALLMMAVACKSQSSSNKAATVLPGCYSMDSYLPLLKGKKVGFVGNHTSLIANSHLVDTLLTRGITISKIFGPEHGFRGDAADGSKIENSKNPVTGIPVISLYGSHYKPSKDDMKGIDIMVFDIQDVGCRFYTYISTLTYIMEACAENSVPLIVLDRPNPNGYYVDGPILDTEFSSYIGKHPVPVVYGMTIGEYANMVNGEKWLEGGIKCDLKIIPCQAYTHSSRYMLPVKPSPNLPTMNSIYLYPSLCFFEGTVVSVGRGTDYPFEIIGHPNYVVGSYKFTPRSIKGVSEFPPFEGVECFGTNLSANAASLSKNGKIELSWLIFMYQTLNLGDKFFLPYFNKLAGSDVLQKQIQQGLSAKAIRESWNPDLEKFRSIRKKYLLYPDFN